MTTFGIFLVGCWAGFILGLIFAGTAGMLSRPDNSLSKAQKEGYPGHGNLAGTGQIVSHS